jgi:hypothetical protein
MKKDEMFDPKPKANWNWLVGTIVKKGSDSKTFEETAKENNKMIKSRSYMPIKLKRTNYQNSQQTILFSKKSSPATEWEYKAGS